MLSEPMDVQAQFPVRKSKIQKAAFRESVLTYAKQQGYECAIEKGSLGVHNVVIGDAANAKYLITAHYDTPARMLFPNLITPCNFWAFIGYQLAITVLLILPAVVLGILAGVLLQNVWLGELAYFLLLFGELYLMLLGPANPNTANDNTSGVVTVLEIMRSLPEDARKYVCFVLFDLEEAGLIGSSAYRKTHKAQSDKQIVLNLDCVGDGDQIIMFPGNKLKKNDAALCWLKALEGNRGRKSITVRDKGFSIYPSDQKQFPLGVGIAAFHNNKIVGPYCSRIHTPKDTVLEAENVRLLRDALIDRICTNEEITEISGGE